MKNNNYYRRWMNALLSFTCIKSKFDTGKYTLVFDSQQYHYSESSIEIDKDNCTIHLVTGSDKKLIFSIDKSIDCGARTTIAKYKKTVLDKIQLIEVSK